MSHTSRLLVAHLDYVALKLTSSSTLNYMQRKEHAIYLGAYLSKRPWSSRNYDVPKHLNIVPNGYLESEIARPYLVSFVILDLTCRVLEDVPYPEPP